MIDLAIFAIGVGAGAFCGFGLAVALLSERMDRARAEIETCRAMREIGRCRREGSSEARR